MLGIVPISLVRSLPLKVLQEFDFTPISVANITQWRDIIRPGNSGHSNYGLGEPVEVRTPASTPAFPTFMSHSRCFVSLFSEEVNDLVKNRSWVTQVKSQRRNSTLTLPRSKSTVQSRIKQGWVTPTMFTSSQGQRKKKTATENSLYPWVIHSRRQPSGKYKLRQL